MSRVCLRGGALLVSVSLLILLIAGCSGLGQLGSLGGPKPQPTPKPTPRPTPKPQPKTPDVQSIIDNGKAQRKAGDFNAAINSFKEALAIEPQNQEASSLLADTQQEREELVDKHMKQGLQYFSDDNLQEALKEWEIVLKLDPTNAKAQDYKERTQKRLDALQ